MKWVFTVSCTVPVGPGISYQKLKTVPRITLIEMACPVFGEYEKISHVTDFRL